MAQVNLGHVVGPGVPTGGTAGQVLKKNRSTNFDASWATLNSGNIPVSASDNTTVQQSLAATKGDIGIVEDGDTATHTIPAGYYVIWKGALYTASAAIPSGTTLSSSNLTAVPNGGLNALNGNLQNKFHTKSYTFSNLSFESGELATRGLQVSQDISSDISSYGTPVSALITHIDDSGKCNFQIFIFNSMLYVNGYRASVNSMGSNKVIVLVLFVKS